MPFVVHIERDPDSGAVHDCHQPQEHEGDRLPVHLIPTPDAADGWQALADLLQGAGPALQIHLGRRSRGRGHTDQALLPDDLVAALQQVADSLSAGRAVMLRPQPVMISTQEAADILSVSRPTLVKMLDDGRLPYTRISRHRRLRLGDVLRHKTDHKSQADTSQEAPRRLKDPFCLLGPTVVSGGDDDARHLPRQHAGEPLQNDQLLDSNQPGRTV